MITRTEKLFFISSIIFNGCFTFDHHNKMLWSDPTNVEEKVRETTEKCLSYFSKDIVFNDTMHFYISHHPSPITNLITYFSYPHEEITTSLIQSLLKYIRTHNITLTWLITPSCKPNNLSTILKNFDAIFIGYFPTMICFLDELPHTPLREEIIIKKLDQINEIEPWVKVIARQSAHYDETLIEFYNNILIKKGLNENNIERYAAYYNNELVGAATFFINGESAGLYHFAVKSSVHNQGIGSYLLNFLLKRAQNLQLKYIVVRSSPHAEKMYHKVGFKKVFDTEIYTLK